ncbi:hypothetical protein DTO217A2_8632 [Paecilomyces variotii]|nr:hypothetical protein DTO217A2_8632 [Paecilomyces variotii]
MKRSLLFSYDLAAAQAVQYCPLLGPVFPPAVNPATSEAFNIASRNITRTLDELVQAAANSSASSILDDTNSFTIQIYSASKTNPLFEYYHTAPLTSKASSGVHTVDEDTVFRIGSGSKLWTLLLFLIAGGEKHFNNPITEYIPELRKAARNTAGNTTERNDLVDFTRWEDTTVLELASHLAGLGRDYGFLDLSLTAPSLTKYGFPQLPQSEIPPCGAIAPCNRSQFFEGITKTHPMAPTSFTPIYSNAAIQILSYVLEAISGHTYGSLLSKHILEPLNMTRSYISTPPDQYGVIPGDATSSGWNIPAGDETPAGGLYSSTKDMTTLGRAILNNTLISPALTRRWMRPVTHTGSLDSSVGAPWEIYSFQGNGRVIDLYTKAGDLGSYSSMTALSPDHGVGFTILAAGDDTTSLVAVLSDLISAQLLPALEQAAKVEANTTYAGTYESVTATSNSSISISIDDGPGLRVEKWISNSVDMFDVVSSSALTGISNPIIHLNPTGLHTPSQVSFRAIFVSPSDAGSGTGPFTKSCSTWELVDQSNYGNVGLDEFLFELDPTTGEVKSISPRALRETLPKTS